MAFPFHARERVMHGRAAVLEVEEGGIRVDAVASQRWFEPLHTTKTHEGGTGMDLGLARDIVAGPDGRIDVESDLGEGGRILVFLALESSQGGSAAAPGRAR